MSLDNILKHFSHLDCDAAIACHLVSKCIFDNDLRAMCKSTVDDSPGSIQNHNLGEKKYALRNEIPDRLCGCEPVPVGQRLRRQQPGGRTLVAERIRSGRPGQRHQLHHCAKAHRCGQTGQKGQVGLARPSVQQSHAAGAGTHVRTEHSGLTDPWPLNWPGDQYSMTFMDELVTVEIGQVGTQWDGLAHPMMRVEGVSGWKDGDYFYNKNRLQDVQTARGMNKVGTENAGGFFTRGILIDIAALKGVKTIDRKSTHLNSSHTVISYAVFCLKKKKKNKHAIRNSGLT